MLTKINEKQYKIIIEKAKQNSAFIAEINGNDIQNINEYFKTIWKVFRFPDTGYVNYHAYLDWIRDLSWLNSNEYIFIIRNFNNFMKQLPRDRQIIINSIESSVIPWWEGEVEQYVVEGKSKPFNVYLID